MNDTKPDQTIRSARPLAPATAGRLRFRLGVPVAALAIACGGADAAAPGGADSLQAVLSIERLEHAAEEEIPSASAIAQFLVLPAEVDAHETLDAAGLRTHLPGRSGCVEAALGDVGARPVDPALAPFPEQLELLEAGDVSVDADGVVTRLALNLFPPSGSASGVIYTTPDQSALPLPADTEYAIIATGSDAIPPLALRSQAPSSLRDVTLAGIPLDRAPTITRGQPLDFTWLEGDPGDAIYVELSDAENSVLCGFADSDGSGTLPGSFTTRLIPGSAARVSVHRVRETRDARESQRAHAMLLETMVRFDFELTALLRVQ